jgi:23S rRNA (cytidine1920-2'-O)/16S rRNA (cytidine1409-2'-O)-methyltransferase
LPISEPRRRLDQELVRRGLVSSRTAAAALIGARRVLVSGAFAEKGARLVAADDPVEVIGPLPPHVGRGGDKLAGAIDEFAIDPTGRWCLDAGSSTGGFTDCLLQRGARGVVAVDVGRGQLHPKLRDDDRVDVREQTDIRSIEPHSLGEPIDLVVADLSFIGLALVLPTLVRLAAPGADLVLLVKPQFEAGAAVASKGKGVISDPEVWCRVLIEAMEAVAGSGAAMMGAMVSPLRGAAGNVEFFVHASMASAPGPFPVDETARALASSAATERP